VGNSSFFRRAFTAREFTVSGYRPDPVTGKPMLILSYPAVDRGGATWAVVFAELDLDWMAQLADKAQLPRGTEITVADSDGLVLARFPDYASWAGKSAESWPVLRALRRASGESTLQGPGLEGESRIFGFTALADPKHEKKVFVTVGIPRDTVLAEADRLLVRNLMGVGLVVVLMLVAAAIVSDLLILRRLAAVVRAAGQLTAGDLVARATVRGADEIGVMAGAFNTMAARLQARVRDEERIKEGLAARVNELDLLNRMSELFQACLSVEEASTASSSRTTRSATMPATPSSSSWRRSCSGTSDERTSRAGTAVRSSCWCSPMPPWRTPGAGRSN
jgi:HAMP domain-containing protein